MHLFRREAELVRHFSVTIRGWRQEGLAGFYAMILTGRRWRSKTIPAIIAGGGRRGVMRGMVWSDGGRGAKRVSDPLRSGDHWSADL